MGWKAGMTAQSHTPRTRTGQFSKARLGPIREGWLQFCWCKVKQALGKITQVQHQNEHRAHINQAATASSFRGLLCTLQSIFLFLILVIEKPCCLTACQDNETWKESLEGPESTPEPQEQYGKYQLVLSTGCVQNISPQNGRALMFLKWNILR